MRKDVDTFHTQCTAAAEQSHTFLAEFKREHEAVRDLWRGEDSIARLMAEQEKVREAMGGPFLDIAKQVNKDKALYESLVGSSEMARWLEEENKLRASLATFEVPKWAEEYKQAIERGTEGLLASKAMRDVVESARNAHEAFDLASVEQQGGLAEEAFESISDLRRQRLEPPIQPVYLPPNPILETNKRLRAVEEEAAGTRAAVNELGKMVGHLGVLAAKIQVQSEEVNKRSLRIAYISTAAAIVAVLLAGVQVWVQLSDNSGRARLESRVDELQAVQARNADDAAELRYENARLTAEIKAIQKAQLAPRTSPHNK
jgi:hypothetical protein